HSAPYVHEKVQVVELSSHRTAEIGDVPCPDLARSRRLVLIGAPPLWWPFTTAMGVHLAPLEQPVDRGFRSDVDAQICQNRHDLAHREIAVLGRGHELDDLLPLGFSYCILRGCIRSSATVLA